MSSFSRILFLTILAFALLACGAPATQPPSPTETASLSTATPAFTPTSVATVTLTAISEIPLSPASIVPLEERLLATVEIFQPDEILLQDFISIKTDDGHLIQVDPDTNEITGDIEVDTTTDPFHFCQGLGTDGEHIWVCSATGDAENIGIDVVRVDPGSLSVVETFEVGKLFDQLDMPFLANQIWVLVDNGNQLLGIDVTANQPGTSIHLGARCFQVAVVAESLMVTCAQDDLILQIDPESGEIMERLFVESPRNIAGTENAIWVVQDNGILRLDPTSLSPVAAFTDIPGVGSRGDIFVTEEAVWVRHETGFLYRIDPASNQIVEQIESEQPLSGGSVLVTSDSIWTTTYDDNLLYRISLE